MTTSDSLSVWLAAWPQLREDLARQVEAAEQAERIDQDTGRMVLKTAVDVALFDVAGLADLVESFKSGDNKAAATFSLTKGRKPGSKRKGGQ